MAQPGGPEQAGARVPACPGVNAPPRGGRALSVGEDGEGARELPRGEVDERSTPATIVFVGANLVSVDADGERFDVGPLDVLYLPMGTRDVSVSGTGRVYLVSAPAHRRTAAALASRDEVVAVELGSAEQSNHRTIRKYVHADGIESNQLVLGITTLEPGSVWNTMPPHVHNRRTEVYLYDGLGQDVAVHLMGEPGRTRQLLLHDGDVVVSPPWSIHCASATSAYSFVWAMAGENQSFDDMDSAPVTTLL